MNLIRKLQKQRMNKKGSNLSKNLRKMKREYKRNCKMKRWNKIDYLKKKEWTDKAEEKLRN